MTLAPGSFLGPYEILSPLGAGGMGEVYRRLRSHRDLPFGHRAAGPAAQAVAPRTALRNLLNEGRETWSHRKLS